MALVEVAPSLAVMDVEVVPDHVHVACRIVLGERIHERAEVFGRAPRTALPENATGLRIEGGEQGARAVPDVLEFAAAGAARSRSAARMLALESLHAGFLVDAHHVGAERWLRVELADDADLFAEIGGGAVEPQAPAMRAEGLVAHDAGDP